MKKITLKSAIFFVASFITVLIFQSCGHEMQQTISETSIPNEDVVKFKNIEQDGKVVLSGPELYDVISEYIDELRSTSTSELDDYEQKALTVIDKVTYKDCYEYLSERIMSDKSALKNKFPDVFLLDDGIGLFEDAMTIVNARNEVRKCISQWDIVKFIENANNAYCYDKETYKNATIDDGLLKLNNFIDEKRSAYTEQDLLNLIKHEATERTSIFQSINNDNINNFANDVIAYMKEKNTGKQICELIPEDTRGIKMLWIYMSIVAAKKYGGDGNIPAEIANTMQ